MGSGGAVLLSARPESVLAALRLSTPAQKASRDRPGDMQFSDAVLRARGQVKLLRDFIVKHEPDLIAIESFVDLASREGKEDRLRWQTPLVIGMIDAMVRDLGYPDERIRYQNPIVLHQLRLERAQLVEANKPRGKRKEHVLVPGDQLVSNEHLISAFLHGSWSVERLEEDQLSAS